MKNAIWCLVVASMGISASAYAVETLDWTVAEGALTSPMSGIQMHGSAVVKKNGTNYVYAIGGNRSGDSRYIAFASMSLDPLTVSSWANATWEFPIHSDGFALYGNYIERSTLTYNGRIYVVGGTHNESNGPDYNGVRVLEPNDTGDILSDDKSFDGAAAGANPPLDRLSPVAAVDPATGYLYVTGGDENTVVQRMKIDPVSGTVSDLTNLSSTTVWPAYFSMGMVINNGYIYIISGRGGNETKVQYAKINSDGTLGAFANTAPLPEARYDGGSAVVNGNIYVVGGTTNTNMTVRNTVFRAQFGANGEITGWETDAEIPATLPAQPAAIPGLRRFNVASMGDEGFVIIGGRSFDSNFLPNLYLATPKISSVADWTLY